MTNSKKKTMYSEEEFSCIVDDAAIILQRKSGHVMNIKQVAEYLGISEGAVRKRCQRKQLRKRPFIRTTILSTDFQPIKLLRIINIFCF